MSLWLALHFPRLALEIYSRQLPDDGPLAVSEQQRIYLCNEAAQNHGIRQALSVSAALALDQTLLIVPRDAENEENTLEQLAQWAGHYTSHVSLQPPHSLVLEIAGSMRYFRGFSPIIADISPKMQEIGYYMQYAAAPTPSAALLLAKAAPHTVIQDKNHLARTLGPMSINHLELPDPKIKPKLRAMGISRLDECLHLPRAGLTRRFGPQLTQTLDRLLGHQADPRPAYQAPAFFRQNCPLPAETDQAQALIFACRRMLLDLTRFLQLRAKGAQQVDFRLFHRKHCVTQFTLSLLSPSQDSQYLLMLLTEQLERLPLPAPVLEIQLQVTQLFSLSPKPLTLFPTPEQETADWTTLVERLSARLGQDAIGRPDCQEDYRPEQAWKMDLQEPTPTLHPPQTRPLWLLQHPQALSSEGSTPFHNGPLELLSSMERIENAWWDAIPVTRDYFMARNSQGSLLWVYRERGNGAQWFLHGIFS